METTLFALVYYWATIFVLKNYFQRGFGPLDLSAYTYHCCLDKEAVDFDILEASWPEIEMQPILRVGVLEEYCIALAESKTL